MDEKDFEHEYKDATVSQIFNPDIKNRMLKPTTNKPFSPLNKSKMLGKSVYFANGSGPLGNPFNSSFFDTPARPDRDLEIADLENTEKKKRFDRRTNTFAFKAP